MQWVTSLWDKIIQSMFLKSVFSTLQWNDWVLIVFLIAGLIYGTRSGFWKVVSAFFRLIIVIALSMEYGFGMVKYLGKYLNFLNNDLWNLIGFFAVGLISWFASTWLIQGLGQIFSAKESDSVRVLGGLVLGTLYAFVFYSFLSQIIVMGPWDKAKKSL